MGNGLAGKVRRVSVGHDSVRRGMDWQAWIGMSSSGPVTKGTARQAWLVCARFVAALPGMVWTGRRGDARYGTVWNVLAGYGVAGMVGNGLDRIGPKCRVKVSW